MIQTPFVLPNEYPLVLAAGLAMNIQLFLHSGTVSSSRRKYFPKEFMEQEFGEVHRKQLGEEIQGMGYPDTGSGLYSARLSYKDWYMFNVYQRIHMNYVEAMPLALSSLLFAGVYNPRAASVMGLLYVICRSIYAKNYVKKGGAMNPWRRFGAIGSLLCVAANIGVFAFYLAKSLKK